MLYGRTFEDVLSQNISHGSWKNEKAFEKTGFDEGLRFADGMQETRNPFKEV